MWLVCVFDDYDRSISEAIKITKQPSPEQIKEEKLWLKLMHPQMGSGVNWEEIDAGQLKLLLVALVSDGGRDLKLSVYQNTEITNPKMLWTWTATVFNLEQNTSMRLFI
ncbi:uncharacterized protein LOC120253341 [Dioscorea cayenensis subsp. rotundata]|uniref:Uncharacterized protein LOC120253341 n=1 Tax=Dioscorea cayennensis subsp. rotundata TaxID=55577 RepID=A0AB40ARM9_DIOCR|nr:uncharacterized protein LOC120253341 [Dioscorea cayenensis subsp. rotundata]